MPDDVRAAAQRITDSRPRSIIDGKQFAADIMLVTRYVLADHNDRARLLGEVERLKAAIAALGIEHWKESRYLGRIVIQTELTNSIKPLLDALAPAPAEAGETVIIEPNTCDACNEVIPDGEGYSHHRWCGLEAVAPGASDAGDVR